MLGRYLTGGCHCRPHDNRSWGPDCAGHVSDPRRFKRAEAREAAEEMTGTLDAHWPDEAARGECRHGCNGDCIVAGIGSDVCDFLCHPGFERDEARAARIDTILDMELPRFAGALERLKDS